jgi:hypothetical protein
MQALKMMIILSFFSESYYLLLLLLLLLNLKYMLIKEFRVVFNGFGLVTHYFRLLPMLPLFETNKIKGNNLKNKCYQNSALKNAFNDVLRVFL